MEQRGKDTGMGIPCLNEGKARRQRGSLHRSHVGVVMEEEEERFHQVVHGVHPPTSWNAATKCRGAGVPHECLLDW